MPGDVSLLLASCPSQSMLSRPAFRVCQPVGGVQGVELPPCQRPSDHRIRWCSSVHVDARACATCGMAMEADSRCSPTGNGDAWTLARPVCSDNRGTQGDTERYKAIQEMQGDTGLYLKAWYHPCSGKGDAWSQARPVCSGRAKSPSMGLWRECPGYMLGS